MGSRNSNWQGPSLEERRFSSRELYSVPLYERLAQLFAIGYSDSEILGILRSEFSDLEVNPITMMVVRDIIHNNKKDLALRKAEMGAICKQDWIESWKENFAIVSKSENSLVRSLAKKIDDLVMAIDGLDMSIDEKTKKPKDLAALGDILFNIERIQKMTSKIAGTDAFREFELFKMKKEYEKHMDDQGGGLLPSINGRPDAD